MTRRDGVALVSLALLFAAQAWQVYGTWRYYRFIKKAAQQKAAEDVRYVTPGELGKWLQEQQKLSTTTSRHGGNYL